jgi:hypothetical protein
MDKYLLNSFIGGWVVGNFNPSLFKSPSMEVGVKKFMLGDRELSHKQLIATEITVINSGRVRIGQEIFIEGDVVVIPPGEYADFEALSDGSLTCIKFPSVPSDKVLE